MIQEKVDTLKSTVSQQQKKIDHLTELLHESEANTSHFDEQSVVLEDEIRSMGWNQLC